ncbi:ABC transporter ATP-binding protein [Pullulanibacillus sp. KACC 23026]|uniref:ABC transporter ATP-binding protein n=1 Tax=Pullulanibacillus sp. KACC 23026 TaxID=3028315 RepID=UPI0023B0A4F4|nr:ABC transporter ATP-binding protein [Pullulanibacillus sp. KACC 23026]WEG11551.1 ABC transporter ATP-binding protein [Pullulanibacillus sp. KACC 23026]
MSEVICKLENLTKRIGKKTVVDRLNLEIKKGEIVGFLGPNGAGKTTTMRMMVGHMAITEGDVKINGYSVKTNKEQALNYVGGIIETPELYKFLTGYDNLLHFQRMTGPINKERIVEVTKLVGLTDAIHQKVKTYSLGMRQRLGIAQAILTSPELLILDEPTNGLDPSGIREVREYLRKLAKEHGMTIFVSSHLLAEIELLCDRIIIIQKGQITDTEEVHRDERKEKVTIALQATPTDKVALFLQERNIPVIEQKEDTWMVSLSFEDLPAFHRQMMEQNLDVYTVSLVRESLEERFLQMTTEKVGDQR